MQGLWNGPVWGEIIPIDIASFRPEGSGYEPETKYKLAHCPDGLFGIFQVKDKYIHCVHTEFQSHVYKDSCVEIFLQPKPDKGYFNFEFNCGGSLLTYYISDHTPVGDRFKEYLPLSPEADQLIKRFHSLPKMMQEEERDPMTWYLEFFIPFSIMEKHIGSLDFSENWRGNLFKCGDETSHPHWGSWAPVDEFNFHTPHNFGSLQFAK